MSLANLNCTYYFLLLWFLSGTASPLYLSSDVINNFYLVVKVQPCQWVNKKHRKHFYSFTTFCLRADVSYLKIFLPGAQLNKTVVINRNKETTLANHNSHRMSNEPVTTRNKCAQQVLSACQTQENTRKRAQLIWILRLERDFLTSDKRQK